MTLPERVLELHRRLSEHRLDHAFGGAIALAYWTLDPRGTSDVDVNVFVPAGEAGRVLDRLPAGVRVTHEALDSARRDGQVRVWWDDTPLDLFFDYAPVHGDAARHRRMVPFAGEEIPILGAVELAVFKAMFDRTRDWADIEAMIAAGSLDLAPVRRVLGSMLDGEDSRFARLDEAVRRASGPEAS